FAKTHPKWRSPVTAIYIFFASSLVVAYVAGGVWGPVTGIFLVGTVLTIAVLPIYMLAAISCPVYYLRYRRSEFNVLLHLIIPLLGVAFLVPAFCAGAGITIFRFVAPLSYPLNLAGPIVAVWYVIGIAIMVHLMI